jgi:hypothetical protein
MHGLIELALPPRTKQYPAVAFPPRCGRVVVEVWEAFDIKRPLQFVLKQGIRLLLDDVLFACQVLLMIVRLLPWWMFRENP